MQIKVAPGGITFNIPFEGKLTCPKHKFELHGCKACDMLRKANYQLGEARDVIEKWTNELVKAIDNKEIVFTVEGIK